MDDIKDELVGTGCSNNLFRLYTIQGQDEPQRQFLLHKNHTDNFDAPQPGYRYAQITMKAWPLSMLPRFGKVSEELAVKRKIPGWHWDIGIHLVCYRWDHAGMGDLAYDNQGKTQVFCLLVDQVEISSGFGLWVVLVCQWKSFILKLPIRVFRKEKCWNEQQLYSYGGLYSLVRVDPPIEQEESFWFYLSRRPARGG